MASPLSQHLTICFGEYSPKKYMKPTSAMNLMFSVISRIPFVQVPCLIEGAYAHILNLSHMGMGQNPIPLVNIKIAGKWMFIPLKMVLIGIDP